MPKKYLVEVREVWVQVVEVEADSKEESIKLVEDDNGEYVNDGFEFSHRLGSSTWTSSEKRNT